jgi:hypothetical protein
MSFIRGTVLYEEKFATSGGIGQPEGPKVAGWLGSMVPNKFEALSRCDFFSVFSVDSVLFDLRRSTEHTEEHGKKAELTSISPVRAKNAEEDISSLCVLRDPCVKS